MDLQPDGSVAPAGRLLESGDALWREVFTANLRTETRAARRSPGCGAVVPQRSVKRWFMPWNMGTKLAGGRPTARPPGP
jgi:hypothetical protein